MHCCSCLLDKYTLPQAQAPPQVIIYRKSKDMCTYFLWVNMHCCSGLLDKYGSRQRSVGSMPLAGMAAGRSVLGRLVAVPTV